MIEKNKRKKFTEDAFQEYFGQGLTREASLATQEQNLARAGERTVQISYKSKKMKTAGISSKTLSILEDISNDIGEDLLKQKLQEDYSVTSVLDLKEDEAKFLISQFENK